MVAVESSKSDQPKHMFAAAKSSAHGIPVCLPFRGPALSWRILILAAAAETFAVAGHMADAHAAPIVLGNAIPGTVISKPIQSLRERKFENLVRQQTDFSCGAAAVATILKYFYGKEIGEAEVIKSMLEVSDPEVVKQRGFSMLDMKVYMQSIGMRARGYQVAPYMLESIKVPVIVLLNINGYSHFVVLKKTINDGSHPQGLTYLADPILGNRVMNKEDFLLAWNGIAFAIIGPGVVADSVLINPSPPLTAQALRGTYARLRPNELLEYGFKHADFF